MLMLVFYKCYLVTFVLTKTSSICIFEKKWVTYQPVASCENTLTNQLLLVKNAPRMNRPIIGLNEDDTKLTET